MNNLIIVSILFVVAIGIGLLGNSNYETYILARDQRNLQATVDDCKNMFPMGLQRDGCIENSLRIFGTDYQKEQWERRLDYP